ncbi:hypothetical protein KKH07_01970 [Patescibacteria group bacterium]|nr:hypothetical protein [Patescibacteria group bacterium]
MPITIEQQNIANLQIERQRTRQRTNEKYSGKKTGRIISRISSAIVQKMTKAVEDKQSWVWPFSFMLAAFNDLADIGIIGSIPIVGDIIDLIVWAILFGFTMSLGGHIRLKIRIIIFFAGFLELIPFVDIIPTWFIAILWGWYITQKKGDLAEQGMKDSKKGRINSEAITEFK